MRLSTYGALTLFSSLVIADLSRVMCPFPASYNSKCACHRLTFTLRWCGDYPQMQPEAERLVLQPLVGTGGFRQEGGVVVEPPPPDPNFPGWARPDWVKSRCLDVQPVTTALYTIWRSPYYLCQGTTDAVLLPDFNRVYAWADFQAQSMDCVLC